MKSSAMVATLVVAALVALAGCAQGSPSRPGGAVQGAAPGSPSPSPTAPADGAWARGEVTLVIDRGPGILADSSYALPAYEIDGAVYVQANPAFYALGYPFVENGDSSDLAYVGDKDAALSAADPKREATAGEEEEPYAVREKNRIAIKTGEVPRQVEGEWYVPLSCVAQLFPEALRTGELLLIAGEAREQEPEK